MHIRSLARRMIGIPTPMERAFTAIFRASTRQSAFAGIASALRNLRAAGARHLIATNL